MKKIIYLSLVLPLILISCETSPRAYFSADPGNPVVGEDVWFTNESDNAMSFEWNFGDGYISNEPNPVHRFTATGTYTIVLKAWSENGLADEASLSLEVKIPTLLEIEVLEYYEEYPVEGASVILYPTLNDWDEETNMINEGFTDSDGYAVFSDLDYIVYYVDVWEENHDNYSLRNEDVGFIRTSEIIPNKINRFIAYVDFVDRGKGEMKRDRTMVIKKLERKASEKSQSGTSDDTTGWEVLYNKRAGKK
jgi:PKD repeat protein